MKKDADYWIEKLQLTAHPEGGYFKEIYRSVGKVGEACLPQGLYGERNYATSIYFLLESHQFSAFHRIAFDEIWHFYEGSPVGIYVIDIQGNVNKYLLGRDIEQKQQFQIIIPANHWFAAEVIEPESFSLVGCTVSLGFDFQDFELARKNELLSQFPQAKDYIERFCIL
ncbi:MAG: cupin domain-containing protein [Microscillaceae bacterium]|nr:cupin domain-containing protein [Microscillaceae bacterium]MDW8461674.1 cupin domain-containing protein [Cytophagales bacterium]